MDSSKARIFVRAPDEGTMKQFNDCISKKFVTDAALMPDAHLGYVAPIGAVIVTKGVVVPSWVGYDIGCGVTAIKLSGKDLRQKILAKREEIFAGVKSVVPMGLGKLKAEHEVHIENKQKFKELLRALEKKPHNKEVFDFIKRKGMSNLGSIGHGNHFAEIAVSGKEIWIVIHSGSRNIGHKTATHYMKESQKLETGETNTQFENTYSLKTNSALGKEYLAVLNFLLEFALLNRIEIGASIADEISKILGQEVKSEVWTNKNHNHAVPFGTGKYIHRKGATPSEKGERGVIPGNMRDGSFLVVGRGAKEFIKSSSHGAGRVMSKTRAKQEVQMEDFKRTMNGITASVVEGTKDESPMAYKNVFEVLKAQKKSIRVVKQLKPIINWKGY